MQILATQLQTHCIRLTVPAPIIEIQTEIIVIAMSELIGSGTIVRIQIEILVEAIVDLRNHAELLILVMFQLGKVVEGIIVGTLKPD
ncbi:hypothetical protein ACFX15_008982 [Malus domestica]